MPSRFAILGLFTLPGATGIQSRALEEPQHVESKYPDPKCVVFHSQHKSAGRTVERALSWYPLQGGGFEQLAWKQEQTCKLVCDQPSWNFEQQKCLESERGYVQECSRNHQYLAYRGYTPTLSGHPKFGHAGAGPCVWATMSREPVSRLVSAFYYCKDGNEGDPLCGRSSGFDWKAKDIKLIDFAKLWGNFLLREIMFHPEVKEFAAKQEGYNGTLGTIFQEPWFQYKTKLNGGDDTRTKSGALNLARVAEHLDGKRGALYDVFGVVEMWNETMLAFDERMPLEHKSWLTASALDDTHGSEKYKDEEKAELRRALNNDKIKAELNGDLFLYWKVIVPRFKAYVEDHQNRWLLMQREREEIAAALSR